MGNVTLSQPSAKPQQRSPLPIPRRHWPSPKQERPARPLFRYDLVLPCHLSDLCEGGKGFWPVNIADTPEINMGQWYGNVVGVLGQYNKGKTWILGRLRDCLFESEGMTVRTEGISFKWMETRKHYGLDQLLVADTAGLYGPMTLKQTDDSSAGQASASGEYAIKGTQFMQEHENSEHEQFLISLTLGISNYIIIVMNETTLPDQRFLLTIASKWIEMQQSSTRDNEICQEIFVVHNFRNTTNFTERDTLFKQSTEDIWNGRMATRYTTVKFFVCRDLDTRHVCLMQDKDEKCQKYNDKVFAILREWICNILPNPVIPQTPRRIAEQFVDLCTDFFQDRGYVRLLNIKKIRLEETEIGLRCVPEKTDEEKPIEFATARNGKCYGLLDPFRPQYTVVQYRAKNGNVCKLLRLEVPGVKVVRVNRLEYAMTRLCHWGLEISGWKLKTDYGISEIRELPEIKENSKLCPADENALVNEPEVDSCTYGYFNLTFQLNIMFKRSIQRIGPRNGVFYLFFESEDFEDSDDFDK